MHLPRWLKSKPMIFVTGLTLIVFGAIVLRVGVKSYRHSGYFDRRLVYGPVYILLGFWALLANHEETNEP